MTSATDPHGRFKRLMLLQVGLCWALVVLAGAWAWWVPPPADPPASAPQQSSARSVAALDATVDPTLWQIDLWRPFVDVAPSSAPARPLTAKLYSILRQGDALIAAIAPDPEASMVYLQAGDTSHGFTVVRVEEDGVVLRVDGREQRLELGP